MKILDIDSEQEDKLLKLCERFFPEYITTFIPENNSDRDIHTIEFWDNRKKAYDTREQQTFIHWYQLVYTELPKRIGLKINSNKVGSRAYEQFGVTNGADLMLELSRIKTHPLDFLWDLVKYFNKNKLFKK